MRDIRTSSAHCGSYVPSSPTMFRTSLMICSGAPARGFQLAVRTVATRRGLDANVPRSFMAMISHTAARERSTPEYARFSSASERK